MPPNGNKSKGKSEVEADTSSISQQILMKLKKLNSTTDTVEQKVSGIKKSLHYHVSKVDELKTDMSTIKCDFHFIQ